MDKDMKNSIELATHTHMLKDEKSMNSLLTIMDSVNVCGDVGKNKTLDQFQVLIKVDLCPSL